MSEPEIIEAIVVEERNKLLETIKYLVSTAVYCIVGLAIDYWFFIAAGATTAWTNPLTYAVMVFWPFILMWKFLIIVFWIAVVCFVIWMVVELITRNR